MANTPATGPRPTIETKRIAHSIVGRPRRTLINPRPTAYVATFGIVFVATQKDNGSEIAAAEKTPTIAVWMVSMNGCHRLGRTLKSGGNIPLT
jgi:hypothetical protein